MNEPAVIARFLRPFGGTGGVALGPGDDAALVRPTPGLALVATTDAVLEGVHFSRAFRPEDIGHKALAVNLSDLAAMGALPRWFLVALELPPNVAGAKLDGIARGMAALAHLHRCALVGGNVVRASRLGITITALGEVPERHALRRDALRHGDVLAVTGALGGAAAGLKLLRHGNRRAALRQLRPMPRVAAGLAAIGLARAGIDVSDGLALDLHRMAQASGVRVDLRSRDVPVAQGAALVQALSGGEDYELVFGGPPSALRRLARKVPLHFIGTACRGRGLFIDGKQLPAAGHDHFAALRS